MNQRNKFFTRSRLLIFLLCVILSVFVGNLFSIQVIHHEEYLALSSRSITKVEAVEAGRGVITDRSGRVLISNRSTYNLTLDTGMLSDGADKNAAILRLITLCQSQNVPWADNLPLSAEAPFSFTVDDATNRQRNRFLSYLKKLSPAKEALETYLAQHPVESPDTESAEPAEPASALDSLTGAALTTTLLRGAGITPSRLVSWMRTDMDIPDAYSAIEARAVLGVRYELELRSISAISAYVMAEDVDTAFISLLSDGDYVGAKITSASTRNFETLCAAHVLGSVGRIQDYTAELAESGYDMDDVIGDFGAEAAFESYLRGTDGRKVVAVNSSGKVTEEYYSEEPQPGNTVELTLDLHLQQTVEEALAELVEKMNAKDGLVSRGAGAAVIKVGTGETLALASYPTFDLSSYRQDFTELLAAPAKPLNNRATNGTYAPGSTFKPMTAVAALEEGVINTSDKIFDTGHWTYPGYAASYANCWNRGGHGALSVSQAITNSCNYFFAEMGYRLGLDKLNEYARAFGLGEHSGIEIGDSAGTLATEEAGHDMAPWAAFGQADYLFSPLQLANYIATLVSGGRHCQAHLLKAVRSYDSSEILATGNTEPSNVIDISADTLAAVKKGMHDLTTSTLSGYFKDCVVEAGAKTGTAQVFSDTKNNGVFVCFAPYENPEIAISLVVEQGDAGAALASTAVTILNAYFSEDSIGTAILPENTLLP